jgi:hypothetical protein
VSASSRCANHGPCLREDSSGNQSSTLAPPCGPECTGKPKGLSSTTNLASRNRIGGILSECRNLSAMAKPWQAVRRCASTFRTQ